MEKIGNYNKITSELFSEVDSFFAFLETEPQIKSIVLNNALYRGRLGDYVHKLRDELGDYEVTERGVDLELDEDRFLEQHQEEMENYD